MNWNIISFSNEKGNIVEYLATRSGLNYFRKEYFPKMHIQNIDMESAFEIESILNKSIKS